jgi:histidinol-phosphate aminotransferase
MGAAGAVAGSWISARGREGGILSGLDAELFAQGLKPTPTNPIVLASNENPMGPGQKVLDAIKASFGANGATPGRYSGANLVEVLAKKHGVQPANIALACGSTQVLRTATHVFTARNRALVATIPTYEECAGYADMMGHPVRPIPLDANFQMDLGRFADASRGAGLVFFCNPSTPTATYTGARDARDFFARVHRLSPETAILVDEAYYDYVVHPDHATHIPLAVEDPRIVVARTFSKAFGLAGLRVGYAVGHPDAISKMNAWESAGNASFLNVFASHAGVAAVEQGDAFIETERTRNKAVRDFTMKWFADRGMKPTESQANFMFVNLGRPVKEFRDACLAKGVKVARDFPPFLTHCRISFGTMEEMQYAVKVFGEVTGKASPVAA